MNRFRNGGRTGLALAGAAGLALAGLAAAPSAATAAHGSAQHRSSPAATQQRFGVHADDAGAGICPPRALAYNFSDTLDKLDYHGVELGGLSDLAYDARTRSYVSTVDNHLTDPSRLWFYRNLDQPKVWREPLVLRTPDGTPYTGATADNEGLAVLPNGQFLVSSETEPSIRIFGRDGVQRSELVVPDRFRVAPNGEATSNATLEGLTITPDGQTIVAAMEGTLSGDVPTTGAPASFRRFLVYTKQHGRYELTEQLGYRVDDGFRISEVQAYTNDSLLVMEAAYAPATGNAIKLYAVTDGRSAPDVTGVANLSADPAAVTHKTLIADVTACPTLGATAKQTQTNPLLDNYEGMITRPVGHGLYAVSLISDDNFNATQITRVLDLAALLP